MALSSLFGLLTGGRRPSPRAGATRRRRILRLESLESRLALAAVMEVKVEATDLEGNPVTSVEVGDEFLLTATVQDLRPEELGVFAAYVDIAYDPSLVAVDGDIVYGTLYPNGQEGDTSTPGLIDNAGSFWDFFSCGGTFPCFVGGDEEILFSVPFVATAAGTVTFDVGPPNEPPPIFDALVLGSNDAVPVADIDFIDATLEVTPSATDLLTDLLSNVESLDVDEGIRSALTAKLNAALTAFTAQNAEDRQSGINSLEAFINAVEAQRGIKISDADANDLIDDATAIINLAGSEVAVLV